ncbi:MAG TPA: glycosyltransferase, partial [Anaerolineaceae bacterium]|nr:glycosyltransferase [Anaerolineaceae bacterium]
MARQAKRILFVSHTAEITGPAHSLYALLRQIKDKYEVAVVIPEDGPLCEWLARDGVPVHILSEQRARGITRMVALLRREDFDLVYGNNPSTYARNALIAARLLGRPFIWHFRSIKWHWGWREGIFLRGASRVIAVSQACAEPLLRF